MDQSIVDYFEIDRHGKDFDREASAFHDRFTAVAEGVVQDALASEYVTEDGQRQYSSVLFFTSTHVYEVEKFLSETPVMWIAKLSNITYLGLTPKEYDFTTPSPASRLNFKCAWWGGGLGSMILDLQTSGNNCEQLLKVVRTYIMPNVV